MVSHIHNIAASGKHIAVISTNVETAAVSTGRKNDIYVCMVSHIHNIAASGKHIAVISTNVETDDPEAEIKSAIGLLGAIEDKFFWVSDYYEPCNDPTKDGCFITSSYDATTHFQTCTEQVLDYYEKITGSKLDLAISADPEDIQN